MSKSFGAGLKLRRDLMIDSREIMIWNEKGRRLGEKTPRKKSDFGQPPTPGAQIKNRQVQDLETDLSGFLCSPGSETQYQDRSPVVQIRNWAEERKITPWPGTPTKIGEENVDNKAGSKTKSGTEKTRSTKDESSHDQEDQKIFFIKINKIHIHHEGHRPPTLI
jgi:hypothetical protein